MIRQIVTAEGAVAIWIGRPLDKTPPRLATVATGNKAARIVWAVMLRGEEYRRPAMG